MDETFLQNFQQQVIDKIGNEQAAVIADNFAEMFTKNSEAIVAKEAADKQIEELKSLNEKLVASNGSLLKQIPMSGPESKPSEQEAENKESYADIDLDEMLNDDGSFKEKIKKEK